MKCLNCNKNLTSRSQLKYCSNKCQMDLQYKKYLSDWKSFKVDGSKGISAKGISQHLRKYLVETYGEWCSLCGWKETNPVTKKVPLEIDHVDGNSENNKEDNLRLICPNCHSLTPHFRNLNKGNGRRWRMAKYLKNNKPI